MVCKFVQLTFNQIRRSFFDPRHALDLTITRDKLAEDKSGGRVLRFSKVGRADGRWEVKLIQGADADQSEQNQDAYFETFQGYYRDYRKNLQKDKKNCVFYVHGYNQSFKDNLEECLYIEENYGVGVVAFSWPSDRHLGKSCPEYREARTNAERSAKDLNLILAELESYHLAELESYLARNVKEEGVDFPENKFSFLAFSLGNYLFQKSIELDKLNSKHSYSTLFDNAILCQADVKRDTHIEWGNDVDDLNFCKRVYVTINQNDYGLLAAASLCKVDENNMPLDFRRLGCAANHLNCKSMVYVDFTDGEDMPETHKLYQNERNKHARYFFASTLNGFEVEQEESFEKAFKYSQSSNCYKFRSDSRNRYK